MRILKKIMIILMMGILIVSINGFTYNKTMAAKYLIEEATLYSKGQFRNFNYDGGTFAIQFIVYEKDGKEYPAYCLNKDLSGAFAGYNQNVTVNKLVEEVIVWKVITNGYPFKTAEELNCNSDIEAFSATLIALYSFIYDYDWDKFNIFNVKKIFTPSANPSELTNTECLKQCVVLPSFLFFFSHPKFW